MKNKKALGIEDFCAEMLKEIVEVYIIRSLIYVVNNCLDDGYFPKLIKVTVIQKIHNQMTNFTQAIIDQYNYVSAIENISTNNSN